jgi:hypothetical protein
VVLSEGGTPANAITSNPWDPQTHSLGARSGSAPTRGAPVAVHSLEMEERTQTSSAGAAPDLRRRWALRLLSAQAGLSEEVSWTSRALRLLSPEIAGGAFAELAPADAANVASSYVLTGAGLQEPR